MSDDMRRRLHACCARAFPARQGVRVSRHDGEDRRAGVVADSEIARMHKMW